MRCPGVMGAALTEFIRHLLSHSSGITGFENEMIMQYLAAIGSPVATVIPRYFMSDDEKDKEEALCLLRKLLGTLVSFLVFTPPLLSLLVFLYNTFLYVYL
jgi:hypothetical protein